MVVPAPTKTIAIGIDLGTSNSSVGVYQNGRVEVIPNEFGNLTTPSCVAFTNKGRLVGDAAKDQVAMNPENTIFNVTRVIGRRFDDPQIQQDMTQWPFKIVNVEGKPYYEVEFKGETKRFCPEEISSMLLIKMKEIAEAFLGQKVKDAVIAVPAYFNNSQRQATIDAATIAGLKVVRMISSSTAAAMTYGVYKNPEGLKNILVFDLGGGTFDVSILMIEGGIFEVTATIGDNHLGGEDFDNRLVSHLSEEFYRKYRKDIRSSPQLLRILKTACEQAKRTLSSNTRASLEILLDGVQFDTEITQARFEELNAVLFRCTLEPVEKALRDAKLVKSMIDEIILVGGSTRIPKIQKLLKDFFNGKELNLSINLDEAVAYGAAYQAAVLLGNTQSQVPSTQLPSAVIFDVAPLSLGIKTSGGVMTTLVGRNSRIPCRHSRIYTTSADSQSSVSIQVFEGEQPLANDNNLLGTFTLTGIQRAPKHVPQIKVKFDIDANGIMTVSAKDKRSGNSAKINIKSDKGRLTNQEDETQRERAKARKQYNAYVNKVKVTVENALSTWVENLPDVLRKCQDALKWLDDNLLVEKEVYDHKLMEMRNDCEEVMEKLHGRGASAGTKTSSLSRICWK